jgi:hypothetical protein
MFYVDTISLKALPAASVVNVTVDATQTGRTRLFGVNAAVWDSIFDTPTTIGLLDEMGNQALRFPGGSLSDDYHWATDTTDGNSGSGRLHSPNLRRWRPRPARTGSLTINDNASSGHQVISLSGTST